MSLFFDLFRNEAKITDLSEGQHLFHEGEQSDGTMYVLVAGHMTISVGAKVVEHAGAGAIIGEMALVEQSAPRSATVKAETVCSLAMIDKERFYYLISEVPEFAIEVMRVIGNRLRKVDTALCYNGSLGYQPWRSAGSDMLALQT